MEENEMGKEKSEIKKRTEQDKLSEIDEKI